MAQTLTDVGMAQKRFKPYSDVIDYIKGKRYSVPKKGGINIDRFILDEDLLFITAKNACGKSYLRICIPPDYIRTALEKSHTDITVHGGMKQCLENLKQ